MTSSFDWFESQPDLASRFMAVLDDVDAVRGTKEKLQQK